MCIEIVGYCSGSGPGHSNWVNYKIMATMAAAPSSGSLEILGEGAKSQCGRNCGRWGGDWED